MKRKLILSICGSVKTLKVKDIDKDENNNLMSFHIDDEKLLEKYKTTWTKIEDWIENIPVYDDRYIKTKMRTYREKVYTDFRD